jgi:hypothetical protein
MRRIFYISALGILYLLTTAKSCDNQEKADEERDQARIRVTRDSLKSTFGTDTLSNTALRAFEGTAIIRLSDFADYLAILRDTSLARPFREKAREMILGLFISDKSLIRVSKPSVPGGDDFTIEQFLKDAEAGSTQFGKIIPDSTRVKQVLTQSGESIYAGTLSYSYTLLHVNPSTGSIPSPANGTAEFYLKRHQKNFGADTIILWDVFLGNME